MTFYGSEFITVLFNGLQRRKTLQDFPAFDSSVSAYLERGSAFFFSFSCLTFSFALSFIFFPFKRSELLRLPQVKWYFSYLGGYKSTRTQDSMDVQGQPIISDGFQPALGVPTHTTHEQKGAFISPGDTWICMAVRQPSPLYISQQRWGARSPACRAGKPACTALFHHSVAYFLGNSPKLSALRISDIGLAKKLI